MRGRKRRNDIPNREFDNVVHMYSKEGASLKQIAHTYDVTAYVVRDVLVGMGVGIGPRGRPWKKKQSLKNIEYGVVHTDEDGISSSYVNAGPMFDALALGDFRRPLGE